MKQVDKVMMFVWRRSKGKKEFFVVHRRRGDFVIPTGHVEDGETLNGAASREVQEELGVKPIQIKKMGYSTEIVIENKTKHSTEHAFLVEIPNQSVDFLEHGETGGWHTLDELPKLLTYEDQRNALGHINKD